MAVYRTDGQSLFACRVRLVARGEAFLSSYTEGDNTLVVATDSMKNFVHAVALDFEGYGLLDFLLEVGRRFLDRYDHVESVEVHGHEVTFLHRRGVVLQRVYDDRAVAEAVLDRHGVVSHREGVEGFHLVKLSGSSFAGFVRDEHTTLPETEDRPLFVHLDLDWRCGDITRRPPREGVRATVVEAFSAVYSASIQELLYAMGTGVLERFPEVEEIRLAGENRLWDTAREGEGVLVFTDARPPYGVIHLTLGR